MTPVPSWSIPSVQYLMWQTKMSTDSWTVITLRVRAASVVCILLVCRCMDYESIAKWHSYQWQAWLWFPVKLTWAETPELPRQRRSQRRPTLPALTQRSEIWDTSRCSAKRCAAQWGRSSASSLWRSHGAWLSLAVTSSGAVWNCKEQKVRALYLRYIFHTSRYLEAKQKLQREATSAGPWASWLFSLWFLHSKVKGMIINISSSRILKSQHQGRHMENS